ncbi:MAG TPA: mechanosensitive ion channel domain-containing protein, partial [Humisphaera sp.]
VAVRADEHAAYMAKARADAAPDPLAAKADTELRPLAATVEAELPEAQRMAAAGASLYTLSEQGEAWEDRADRLAVWRRDLKRRADLLDGHAKALRELEEKWWRPTVEYGPVAEAPPEVQRRAESTLAAAADARKVVERSRDRVLALQNLAGEAGTRVAEARAAIEAGQKAAAGRLVQQDSPPLWDALARAGAGTSVATAGQQTFAAQWAAVRDYAWRHRVAIGVHAAVLLGLVPAMWAARRRVRAWAADDASLRHAAAVFESPVAVAALLALLVSEWVYPEAPRLFRNGIGALALAPTIVILRMLLERRLFGVLYALVALYAADQVRGVAGAQPLLARALLCVELSAAALFIVWLLRSERLAAAAGAATDPLGRAVVFGARLVGGVLVAALVAGVTGYVALANLLGDASLGSAYAAVVLYAAARVADGLTMAALRVRPLSLLKMVRLHRTLFWRRARRVTQWAAVASWALITLAMLGARTIVFGWVAAAWGWGVSFGGWSLTVGSLAAFGLTIWASVLVSRFARFVLEEDVYPRFQLGRGLPYAISTTIHYAIVVFGLVTALGAIGFDVTKITILMTAFGVGLGFGLQNIFNNFVSGMILLFERPVKVGDVVQIGPDVGVVRRIGIRASVVRTGSGAEIIMPNSRLIADPVTNWTPGTRGRGIDLPVAVAGGADPKRVIELWERVAAAHPRVTDDPPPRAALVGLGADALRFELHAWTPEFETWGQTRSDLAVALAAALAEAGIGVR